MTRELATAIVIAVAVLVLGAMLWGWRRRARRDAGLVAPVGAPPLPADGEISVFDGFYVATTRHDAPLDRLAVKHLAYRGRVRATVRADGVALIIPGEPEIFLARNAITGVGRATWTIDRVVERDGLVLVAWRLGDETVDSYLRFPDASAAFVQAVLELMPETSRTNPQTGTIPQTGSNA